MKKLTDLVKNTSPTTWVTLGTAAVIGTVAGVKAVAEKRKNDLTNSEAAKRMADAKAVVVSEATKAAEAVGKATNDLVDSIRETVTNVGNEIKEDINLIKENAKEETSKAPDNVIKFTLPDEVTEENLDPLLGQEEKDQKKAHADLAAALNRMINEGGKTEDILIGEVRTGKTEILKETLKGEDAPEVTPKPKTPVKKTSTKAKPKAPAKDTEAAKPTAKATPKATPKKAATPVKKTPKTAEERKEIARKAAATRAANAKKASDDKKKNDK